MKKCIVIGSGFAGLTSAVYLSKAGYKVEVLEAAQKTGGRAYSFPDKNTNTIIDNGQHILMGCYKETLAFLKIINALDNLEVQKELYINFLKENNRLFPLKASGFFYPVNLLSGLLNYKAISLKNRILLLKFFIKLHLYSEKELKKLSVKDWLLLENQNEYIRKAFWEILSVGALNTDTSKASAKIFSDILKQIFFNGNSASTIILPKKDLTETYCTKAAEYIESKGGKICLSEQVTRLEKNDRLITDIFTTKRVIKDYNFIISAVPLYSLKKIIDDSEVYNNLELNYSTILSVHLWLKKNLLTERFYALIDSGVHWIFNHNTHLTLVISNANKYTETSREEILDMIFCELEKFTPVKKNDVTSYKIIKEKRATFIPGNEILNKQPYSVTKYKNFFLAGDWINTGLPSTIESAVKSGRLAAEEILY